MKKLFTTLSLAAVASLAMLAESNTGLPDISVFPAPGTTVEQITEIRVESGWIEQRAADVTLYFNNSAYTATATYPDQFSVTFTLDTPITKPGNYQVIIPENSFGYSWENTNSPEVVFSLKVENDFGGDDPDPGHEIFNTVPEGIVFTPAAGTEIPVLSSFSLYAPDNRFLTVSPQAKVNINGEDYDCVNAASGDLENTLTFTLANAITQPGYYTIYIPEGTVIYNEYQYDLPTIRVTVIVTGGEAPAIELYPASSFTGNPVSGSTVPSIKRIAVMSEKLTTLYKGPEINEIKVTKDGRPVDVSYTIVPDEDTFNEAHVMWMTFNPSIAADGNYVISFPEKCFKVNDYPATFYSEAFTLNYIVNKNSGISGTDADEAEAEYFDLTGRRIDNPEPGTFVIVRRGDKVSKVVVR